jgi:hypothetical protein
MLRGIGRIDRDLRNGVSPDLDITLLSLNTMELFLAICDENPASI